MRKNDQNRGFERTFLVIFLIIGLILPMKGLLLLAQQVEDTAAKPVEKQVIPTEDLVKQGKTVKFLDRLKAEINSSQDNLIQINDHIGETEEKITVTEEKIDTLSEQLANLDQQIKSSQSLIENVEAQIEQKQSEVDTLAYQVEQKKVEISFQKKLILEYLSAIFKDNNDFQNIGENGAELNTIKLILSEETTSEKLRSLRYSEILEENGRKIFEKLGEMISEEEQDQQLIEIKKRNLILLHDKLSAEKEELQIKQKAKESLLEQTKGEQSIYQELLEKAKQQQEDVLSQIDTLRKNLAYVQGRMKELGKDFNPDDFKNLLETGDNRQLLDMLLTGSNEEFQPLWPVNPARGVSAYYHDASYVKVFAMQHNAIDIRAYQNTPIRAPADGVVYKAKDNGYGYSYVILAHAGGYMTLYGHVTEILVQEGEAISQGDVIGLSGATPGTRGAGLYTTGPHLHFEVFKDGVHVDPLDYLSLAYLPLDTLPEKYLAKALGDRQKVRRIPAKVKVKNNTELVEDEAVVSVQ